MGKSSVKIGIKRGNQLDSQAVTRLLFCTRQMVKPHTMSDIRRRIDEYGVRMIRFAHF